ncbi:hypothetical protein HK100_009627 [Physocladia obscura]|uniref:Uncharacterized protein n=1 Tax=Physocladia obscura TaxID=109957 RepID=A0AAD5TAD8_9FUNG|nr:hypothetical protein HK100_009627 [Physocladia obscura]
MTPIAIFLIAALLTEITSAAPFSGNSVNSVATGSLSNNNWVSTSVDETSTEETFDTFAEETWTIAETESVIETETATTELPYFPTVQPVNIPYGCVNTSQAALVFRASSLLDPNLINYLLVNGLSATFFVPAEFALNNQNLVLNAYAAGHNIGIAIQNASELTMSPTENSIPADRPVNFTALLGFFKNLNDAWNQFYSNTNTFINLKLVAFISDDFIDVHGAFMYPNQFMSLEGNLSYYGYASILVPFGKDYSSESSAILNNVILSNFFEPVLTTGLGYNTTDNFLSQRQSEPLESTESVSNAISFLSTLNITVVSMQDCLCYNPN